MYFKGQFQFISIVLGASAIISSVLINHNPARSASISNFRINVSPTTVTPGGTATATGAFQIIDILKPNGSIIGPFTFTVDLLDSDASTIPSPLGIDDLIGTFALPPVPAGANPISVNLPPLTFTPSTFTAEAGEGSTIEVYGIIRGNTILGSLTDIPSATVNVSVVPEPSDSVGLVFAVGLGIWMKRKHSKRIPKKQQA